jgi:hypothetical protein
MLNAGCPALLVTLSFLVTTNLSDTIFGDVPRRAADARSRQASMSTARDAFFTALVKAALPCCSNMASMTPQHKRITYIALAKPCMPKLAELFLQFKEKDEVFVDRIVGAVLSAYPPPIKLPRKPPIPKVRAA